MKVSEALEDSPFNFYYRQKFDKIVTKAAVGELDLSDDWPEIRRRIQSAFSFNIWGLLFGPMWAVYRGIPYAFIAVLFLAASTAAPMFLAVDEKMLRFLPFSIGAMFGFYGNRWLLGSYLGLMRDYGNAGLAEVETRPSVLQVFLAIAIFGIMQVVVDTPANELRMLAQTMIPNGSQVQLASIPQDGQDSSATSPQFPPGYDTEIFRGTTYGFKLIDGSSCANFLVRCGQVELISPEDCATLTATYKIFDHQDRHIDTDNSTIRDVSANAPVLLKFEILDGRAYRYEVTDVDCS
jgi:hypothetical protein